MCKCNPNIRTPYCANCKWSEKVQGIGIKEDSGTPMLYVAPSNPASIQDLTYLTGPDLFFPVADPNVNPVFPKWKKADMFISKMIEGYGEPCTHFSDKGIVATFINIPVEVAAIIPEEYEEKFNTIYTNFTHWLIENDICRELDLFRGAPADRHMLQKSKHILERNIMQFEVNNDLSIYAILKGLLGIQAFYFNIPLELRKRFEPIMYDLKPDAEK